MNTFGRIYRLTCFGESHGKAIGGVIDGCPPGIELDMNYIQNELTRRRPGQSKITTPRNEEDRFQILSGIFEGKTTGTPIGFLIWNNDQHSDDYDVYKDVFRPSHADYTYLKKYGIRDHRGGGRQSARETISRVVAGAIAKFILKEKFGVEIHAYTSQVGKIVLEKEYTELDFSKIESNIVRCPDDDIAAKMIARIEEIKSLGETIGGTVTCVIQGVPAGLGEPVFDKFQAQLAKAAMSINAAKGFEYGSGFGSTAYTGSTHNDDFYIDENKNVRTRTNNSGGIQGGITNGEDIYFKTVFKPVATIMREQQSIDIHDQPAKITPKGRHDPCVLPRAVPIVEAMAAMVTLDFMLLRKMYS